MSSRVGSLPLYADVRLHILMTHRNDVIRYALKETLSTLRAESEAVGCPFVVGTVIREPVSQAISTFYFTHRKVSGFTLDIYFFQFYYYYHYYYYFILIYVYSEVYIYIYVQ